MSGSKRKPGKSRAKSSGAAKKTTRRAGLVAREVDAADEPLPRTESQWRHWVDHVVDQVNSAVRQAGLSHEAAADLLFRKLCRNDVKLGLDPDGSRTDEYLRVRDREGKSLRLTKGDLSKYVRIGAMNQLRRDSTWRNLDFSFKLELMPLLDLKDERAAFNAGVKFAAGPNASEAHIRRWVQHATPRAPGSVGRPRGESVTLPRAARFTDTGVMLGDEAQREKFLARLRAAPARHQRAIVKNLRETHENLGRLLAQLGGADD